MFIGAINGNVRNYLGNAASALTGRRIVVGCSGNFTSESVISACANVASIHSNDVSLYSTMIGRWLCGQIASYEVVEEEYAWLEEFCDTDVRRIAVLMVLLDLLPWEKRNNPHKERMFALYRNAFGNLVDSTEKRLAAIPLKISDYFAGDAFEHFRRFEDDPDAVFCCYAPTYAGGYERMYKRFGQIFSWDAPDYESMTDDRRNALFAWMRERSYLWYDDRLFEDEEPVLVVKTGRQRPVYLYSNAVSRKAYVTDNKRLPLPKWPLADESFDLRLKARIELTPIKTSDLALFKDAYLSKRILHSAGTWALAVKADGRILGFLEFKRSPYEPGGIYLNSDFPVAGTGYDRMSKLVAQLAISAETKKRLERIGQSRVKKLCTTAFTDRPESMKYRGVMKVVKRGEKDGQKYLNYEGPFNDLSWEETYRRWWTKNASKRS